MAINLNKIYNNIGSGYLIKLLYICIWDGGVLLSLVMVSTGLSLVVNFSVKLGTIPYKELIRR